MSRPEEYRATVVLEIPEGITLPEALSAVAEDMDDGDPSGHADLYGSQVSWRVVRPGDGVELDPRQREAAALLLSAIDLPCDFERWAHSLLEAASVNPGMTMGPSGPGSRVENLRRVRDLIDSMLADLGQRAY